MLLAPPVPSRPSGIPTFPTLRFSVGDYHRMIESGVLGDGDAVELLEGWIAPMSPHGPSHDAFVHHLLELLESRLPGGWMIRIQSAITTPDSEPEPDLAIVPGPALRYRKRHPLGGEAAIVVEIADSSLERDRQIKSRLYARAGVACFWIVNLAEQCVEVYSEPGGAADGAAFQRIETWGSGGAIPVVIAGEPRRPLPVDELFPPADA